MIRRTAQLKGSDAAQQVAWVDGVPFDGALAKHERVRASNGAMMGVWWWRV